MIEDNGIFHWEKLEKLDGKKDHNIANAFVDTFVDHFVAQIYTLVL